jgi:hypothetical protein
MALSGNVPYQHLDNLVYEYILAPDDTHLSHLVHSIHAHKKSKFFLDTDSINVTLVDRILNSAQLSKNKFTTILHFLSQLKINDLNPLFYCALLGNLYSFTLCINLLNTARAYDLLSIQDYVTFFTSALTMNIQNTTNRTDTALHIIFAIQNDDSPPLHMVIEHFPTEIMLEAFGTLESTYDLNRLSRDSYVKFLTAKNKAGLTLLHQAIKSNPYAFKYCCDAMLKIFTRTEHLQFHKEQLSGFKFLEWIEFYGNLNLLKEYAAFLVICIGHNEAFNSLYLQARSHMPSRLTEKPLSPMGTCIEFLGSKSASAYAHESLFKNMLSQQIQREAKEKPLREKKPATQFNFRLFDSRELKDTSLNEKQLSHEEEKKINSQAPYYDF